MSKILHGEILVPTDEINGAIDRVGTEIATEYANKEPLVVGLLTGAYVFTNKVVDSMVKVEPYINPSVDFLRIGSYGSGQISEKARILGDLSDSTEVEGREVIITDDISDSGKTLQLAMNHMYDLGAKVVKVAVMLDRETGNDKLAADYVAIRLKSAKWVVGMGLDGPGTGRGGGRTFPYIAECLVQPDKH